jgi:hypothetical protein
MSEIAELIKKAKALRVKAENAEKQSRLMGEQSVQLKKKAAEHWIELGKAMDELKKKKPKGITWPDLVKKSFGYSQQRADELISIGKRGEDQLKETRAQATARKAKSRSRKSNVTDAGHSGSGVGGDNVVKLKTQTKPKPEAGDCNYNPADPDHVDADTPEQTRRQIFLNMCHHYGCGRKGVTAEPTIGFDRFFSEASPEEATDELFVELERAIAAWNEVADRLSKLKGAANVRAKAKA